jgi:hypothetical protein
MSIPAKSQKSHESQKPQLADQRLCRISLCNSVFDNAQIRAESARKRRAEIASKATYFVGRCDSTREQGKWLSVAARGSQWASMPGRRAWLADHGEASPRSGVGETCCHATLPVLASANPLAAVHDCAVRSQSLPTSAGPRTGQRLAGPTTCSTTPSQISAVMATATARYSFQKPGYIVILSAASLSSLICEGLILAALARRRLHLGDVLRT